MSDFAIVLTLALLPVGGNLVGTLLAESVRTPRWIVGAALHAAAGIAIAVVSIDLMPRILPSTPTWVLISAFLAGAAVALSLALLVRRVRGARAWMVSVAIAADLSSDGLMTGVGAAVASGLGVLIAVSQSVANIPGGFAAAASLQQNGVSKRKRLTVAAMLAIPAVVSCGFGYWLLRDASTIAQNAALAAIIGILLVTTVEDVIPEGDASPRLPRWVSTMALAGGFIGLALLSTYLG
jgi:zinc transporter, ZIP family